MRYVVWQMLRAWRIVQPASGCNAVTTNQTHEQQLLTVLKQYADALTMMNPPDTFGKHGTANLISAVHCLGCSAHLRHRKDGEFWTQSKALMLRNTIRHNDLIQTARVNAS